MPNNPSEDEVLKLIERMQQGDKDARDELIIAHAGIPYELARKYCWGDGNLHDELVTVGYDALIKLIDDGKFDQTRITTCVYVRVSSRMIDHLRKKKAELSVRHESLDTSSRYDDNEKIKEIVDSCPTPVEMAVERERKSLLDQVINELHKKQREVILLSCYEGLSQDEIANSLGESVSAVKSRLFHARAKMRERLSSLLAPTNSVKEVNQNA